MATEALPIDSIEKEGLVKLSDKKLLETFENLYHRKVFPEQPFNAESRTAIFEIPFMPKKVWNPGEALFYLKMRIVRGDNGNPYADPEQAVSYAAAVPPDGDDAGANEVPGTNHARFKSFFSGALIKKIRVVPNGASDIEYMSENSKPVEELFSYLFQYDWKEKKHAELFWNRGLSRHLMMGGEDRMFLGVDTASYDPKDPIHVDSRALEKMARREDGHMYILPVSGNFFSTGTELPGDTALRIEVDFANDETVCYAHRASHGGLGWDDQLAPDPVYRFIPEQCFLYIRYRDLESEKQKTLDNYFFQAENLDIDAAPDFKVVNSVAIQQEHRAQGFDITKFPAAENRVGEKLLFGFVKATDLRNGTRNDPICAFQPFQISDVQIYVDEKQLFDQPQPWQPDNSTRRFMFSTLMDAVASEKDSENRVYGPCGNSILGLEDNYWFMYLNISANQASTLDYASRNFTGGLKVRVNFIEGTDPAANPDLTCILAFPDRKKFKWLQPSSNTWQGKTSYGEGLKTIQHVSNSRWFGSKLLN